MRLSFVFFLCAVFSLVTSFEADAAGVRDPPLSQPNQRAPLGKHPKIRKPSVICPEQPCDGSDEDPPTFTLTIDASDGAFDNSGNYAPPDAVLDTIVVTGNADNSADVYIPSVSIEIEVPNIAAPPQNITDTLVAGGMNFQMSREIARKLQNQRDRDIRCSDAIPNNERGLTSTAMDTDTWFAASKIFLAIKRRNDLAALASAANTGKVIVSAADNTLITTMRITYADGGTLDWPVKGTTLSSMQMDDVPQNRQPGPPNASSACTLPPAAP